MVEVLQPTEKSSGLYPVNCWNKLIQYTPQPKRRKPRIYCATPAIVSPTQYYPEKILCNQSVAGIDGASPEIVNFNGKGGILIPAGCDAILSLMFGTELVYLVLNNLYSQSSHTNLAWTDKQHLQAKPFGSVHQGETFPILNRTNGLPMLNIYQMNPKETSGIQITGGNMVGYTLTAITRLAPSQI